MSIFGRKSGANRKLLKHIDGVRIKYVTQRNSDGTERVIGKEGAVSANEERVLLLCGGRSVFCCPVGAVTCNELLSGDGVVLSGVDSETGREMSVTAHFTSPILRGSNKA